MSDSPRVSICIPCFNEETYLLEAVKSALAQTYHNLIVHVIDNASTDASVSRLKEITDPRLKIHTFTNHVSMFENMNRCLDIASTEFVKILCADDTIEPNCLAKQVEVLKQYEQVGVVFNETYIINAKGERLFTRRLFHHQGLISGSRLSKQILCSGRNPVGEPSSLLLRKNILSKFKIRYNPSLPYSGDLDVIIRMLVYSDAYYLSVPLSSFRVHKKSGSAHLLHQGKNEQILLWQKYRKKFHLTKIDQFLFQTRLRFYFLLKYLVFTFLTQ